MCAAIFCNLLSSFSAVYLERILKGDKTPLLVRNVQLAVYSIPIQLATVYASADGLSRVGARDLCTSSWLVVLNMAFAGLLVAAIMRFADNNLKNLAQALAAICSTLISIPLFGFEPTPAFVVGATIVLGSVFLYVWQPDIQIGFGGP